MVSVHAADAVMGTVAGESFQIHGQELFCNSVSLAYAAARAGYDYGQYLELIQNDTIEVSGLSLPTLQLSLGQYGDFVRFADVTRGEPI